MRGTRFASRSRAATCRSITNSVYPRVVHSNFRFDPTDRARNSMTLAGARIVDPAGTLVRAIPPSQFKVEQQVEELAAGETELTFRTAAAADDPIPKVQLSEPLFLQSYASPSPRKLLRRFAISFVIGAALGLLAGPLLVTGMKPAASRLVSEAAAWSGAIPFNSFWPQRLLPLF